MYPESFKHYRSIFLHGQLMPLMPNRSFIHGRSFVYPVPFIFRGKKHAADQPNVIIRKPNLKVCFAWSYTFVRSFTFLERFLSNMESSMIKTLARSSESKGVMASLIILLERTVVKRIQLIWVIFIKRYMVSFANARVFLPARRFMYILRINA